MSSQVLACYALGGAHRGAQSACVSASASFCGWELAKQGGLPECIIQIQEHEYIKQES